MKYKKLWALAGIALSCNLLLTACYSNSSSKSRDKVTAKQGVKKKHSNAKKGQVPGVDKPTDDGFLFTSESQIKARTNDGLILDHDGHTHFIFYSDLKNSKWAYLIPKNGQAPSTAAAQNLGQASDVDDGYVFNPKDIVSEDENGYVVRHGDHYHYIWKHSLRGNGSQAYQPQTVSSGNASGEQSLPHAQPNYTNPPANPQHPGSNKRQFAGIDYPTSDGFLFDGTGIKEKKSYSLLVNHNGHTHVIPYEQLIQSKWEYLIPAEYKRLLRTLTMVEKIKHRPRQHKILQKKIKKSLRKRPIWHSSWKLMKV